MTPAGGAQTMRPPVPASQMQPSPKVKHLLRLLHLLHLLHLHRRKTIRGEAGVRGRTKGHLIWMSCGVISTASSAASLVAAMVGAPGEDARLAVGAMVVASSLT